MRKSIVLLLLCSTTLAACGSAGGSGLNPLNWFGKGRQASTAQVDASATNPLIPVKKRSLTERPETPYQGIPVRQITSVRLDRTDSGAILTVEGVAQSADAYDLRLIRQDTTTSGLLSYQLQAAYPTTVRSSSQAPRRVVTAQFLTNENLSGIRRVRVAGASNALDARR